MADNTIAGRWLKENGHTWSGKSSRQGQRRTRRNSKAVFAQDRVLYEPLDALAVERLAREAGNRRVRRGPKTPLGMAYVEANVGFAGDECLFFPHSPPGVRASIVFNGRTRPAAAAMCELVHGPAARSQVARHLCGNGHLSCVNPKHLAWGSHADNSRDAQLHHGRPTFWPTLTPEVIEHVRSCGKLTNVLAVELGIHSAVLRTLRG